MRGLRDSVVVITGASSGIGRETAYCFAEHGATVVLAARRVEPLEEAAEECIRRGGQALAVATDVTVPEAVQALAQRTIETYGRIDVWINNAAASLFGRLEEVPLDDFERVIRTNLLGYVYGARAAIPYMREQGEGLIINNASVVAVAGQPYASAYVASKWAIRGLTASLRMELRDAPAIHACTVLPGSIDTPIFRQAANYTGRAAKPVEPVRPARLVAEAMVELAQRPRPERFVGMNGRLLELMHLLAPGWVERKITEAIERGHFQERPAERDHGNLYSPDPTWATVSGGWPSKRPPRTGRWLAISALAAVPAIYYLQRSRRPRGRVIPAKRRLPAR